MAIQTTQPDDKGAISFFNAAPPRWDHPQVSASMTDDRDEISKAIEELQTNTYLSFVSFDVDELSRVVRRHGGPGTAEVLVATQLGGEVTVQISISADVDDYHDHRISALTVRV